jgi:hypothetical protein
MGMVQWLPGSNGERNIMDIQTVTAFFKWCTIINGALLIVSALMFMVAPDLIHGIHGKLFSLPRETFDVVIYAFLGLYKIVFLIFNAVPYVALLIVGRK